MTFILFIVGLLGTAAVAWFGYVVGWAAGRKSVAEDSMEELVDLVMAQAGQDRDATISRIKEVLGKKRV